MQGKVKKKCVTCHGRGEIKRKNGHWYICGKCGGEGYYQPPYKAKGDFMQRKIKKIRKTPKPQKRPDRFNEVLDDFARELKRNPKLRDILRELGKK